MSFAAGTRLGPYEILGPLGAGGMGVVYRARDTRLDREVAVKVLPDALRGDADRLRRFEQEAKATSMLNHPNILGVLDVGEHDGAPYIVAELLEGQSLRERLTAPIPQRRALELAAGIARGLAAAHERGIVHRDLKPENLFVLRDGRAKILDFGLAKASAGTNPGSAEDSTVAHTADGAVLGTAGYMSPEQVEGRAADVRSDIFSFGAILYEMLTGRRAFDGATSAERCYAILKLDPPDPSTTPAIARVVMRCLEKVPGARFQSALDLAFSLESLLGVDSSLATAVARPRRRSLAVPVAAATAVALIAGAYLLGRRRAAAVTTVAPVAVATVPSFQRITYRRVVVYTARFAPDGKSVLYDSVLPDHSMGIFQVVPGTPESGRIGTEAMQLRSVASTGELLVRISKPTPTLARMPLLGGAPRELMDGRGMDTAEWDPAGKHYLVIRPRASGGQTLEWPAGNVVVEVGEGASMGWARFSPAGDRIAYSETHADGTTIQLTTPDGGHVPLGQRWEVFEGLVWAPDGKEIWFLASHGGLPELRAIDLDGHERLLLRLPGMFSLLDIQRDGRLLVDRVNDRGLLFGAGPGSAREVPLNWFDTALLRGLSTDGKTVLFDECGPAFGGGCAVYTRPTTGEPAKQIADGASLALSSDGSSALLARPPDFQELAIASTGVGPTVPLDAGKIARLDGAGWFFPDGKRVLIVGSERDRPSRGWSQEPGGVPVPVTDEGVVPVLGPSPDGASLLVQSGAKLQLVPVAGGDAVDLPGTIEQPLGWTGDGRSVYALVRDPSIGAVKIVEHTLATGGTTPWRTITPEELSGVRTAAVTPDGSAYVYSVLDFTGELYVIDGVK